MNGKFSERHKKPGGHSAKWNNPDRKRNIVWYHLNVEPEKKKEKEKERKRLDSEKQNRMVIAGG